MTKDPACGNNPALSRRAVLGAIPAAAIAAPGFAAPALDPVAMAFAEWLEARRLWRDLAKLPGNEDWSDPRSLAAEVREAAAEKIMLSNTPTTPEGMAALAALAWSYVKPSTVFPDQFEKEARSPEAQAVAAIWRACTGRDG